MSEFGQLAPVGALYASCGPGHAYGAHQCSDDGGGNNARATFSNVAALTDFGLIGSTMTSAAASYANDVGGIVDQLQAAGAQNIIVWNTPNIGLAPAIKALPLRLVAPRPLDEAISSAGGVRFEAVDAHLMLHARPGVFVAGEMLDWEAPTGGYLLTASLASGVRAARGVLRRMAEASVPTSAGPHQAENGG